VDFIGAIKFYTDVSILCNNILYYIFDTFDLSYGSGLKTLRCWIVNQTGTVPNFMCGFTYTFA